MKRTKVNHNKNHQITKEDSKKRTTKQTEYNLKNDNSKSVLMNIYFEYKWIKLTTQKI